MESIKLSFSNKDLNLLKGCVYIDYDPKDCIIDICTGEDKGSCAGGIDICHIDHSDCENIDQCVSDTSGGCYNDTCTLNDEDHCWGSDTSCGSGDGNCAANDGGCSGNDNCWWDSCNMDSNDHCHGAG